MSRTVSVDELDKAIEDELKIYSDKVLKKLDESAKKHIKDMRDDTKRQRFKRDHGEFRKAISTRKSPEYHKESPSYIWYVKKPHYRLAHLLEKGHRIKGAVRKKGKTVAYRFIQRAEARAVKDFEKDVERILKDE